MNPVTPTPAAARPSGRAADVQFEDLGKQAHAVRFGIWVFLASELLLFAGLFALYTAYRTEYPAGFAAGVAHAERAIGTINTSLLIVSSYTAASALRAIRRDRRRVTVAWLLATLVLGAVFLALKGLEYSHHAADGALPGVYYAFRELPTHGGQLFFTLYYFMTGLHALHVIAGLALVAWALGLACRRRGHLALELVGLYWHFVDAVWVFLWPLFYLLP